MRPSEARMQELGNGMEKRATSQSKHREDDHSPPTWSLLAVLALALAAGGITARLEAGPKFDWLLLMTAMGLTAAVAMRLLADNAAEREAALRYGGDPLKDLLDSAGTLVMSIGLDGRLTYMNPAAERQLGYHAEELMKQPTRTTELLPPGEEDRLVAEVQKLFGVRVNPEPAPGGSLAAYAEVIRTLAPSQVPSFETHLRRKDGSLYAVRLHISALRNRDGEAIGLVAMALGQGLSTALDQPLRASRERYRDLFENSSEMMATLDLGGKFL